MMAWALLWLFFLRGAATLYDVAEMGTSLRREYHSDCDGLRCMQATWQKWALP